MLQEHVAHDGGQLRGTGPSRGAQRSRQFQRGLVQRLPGPDQRQQFLHHAGRPLHLFARSFDRELVPAKAEVGGQQLLEGAEVGIVLAHEQGDLVVIQIQSSLSPWTTLPAERSASRSQAPRIMPTTAP
jgi:hypothetical protein